jgi:hypothetical protein
VRREGDERIDDHFHRVAVPIGEREAATWVEYRVREHIASQLGSILWLGRGALGQKSHTAAARLAVHNEVAPELWIKMVDPHERMQQRLAVRRQLRLISSLEADRLIKWKELGHVPH